MQIELEPGALGREGLALAFRDAVSHPTGGRTSGSSGASLWSARQDLQRLGRWEQLAWLGLALSAMGVLVLSLWF